MLEREIISSDLPHTRYVFYYKCMTYPHNISYFCIFLRFVGQ